MLIVSHNPDFVDNLGIERTLILPEGELSYYDRSVVEHYHELNSNYNSRKKKRMDKVIGLFANEKHAITNEIDVKKN